VGHRGEVDTAGRDRSYSAGAGCGSAESSEVNESIRAWCGSKPTQAATPTSAQNRPRRTRRGIAGGDYRCGGELSGGHKARNRRGCCGCIMRKCCWRPATLDIDAAPVWQSVSRSFFTYVLETLGDVYRCDAEAREAKLSPAE